MNESRRTYLKKSLAIIAGVVGGHSILVSNVSGQVTATKSMSLRLPETLKISEQKANLRVLTTQSKRAVAESIAPTFEHFISAAGLKLSTDEIKSLNAAFAERGVISIKPGGANMEATLSVEVNSLNYTSRTFKDNIRALAPSKTLAPGAVR